jgi:hypothetical protein
MPHLRFRFSTVGGSATAVDLIAESGGKWVFIGMESLDPANLKDVNKSFNKPAEYSPSWRDLPARRRGRRHLAAGRFREYPQSPPNFPQNRHNKRAGT